MATSSSNSPKKDKQSTLEKSENFYFINNPSPEDIELLDFYVENQLAIKQLLKSEDNLQRSSDYSKDTIELILGGVISQMWYGKGIWLTKDDHPNYSAIAETLSKASAHKVRGLNKDNIRTIISHCVQEFAATCPEAK